MFKKIGAHPLNGHQICSTLILIYEYTRYTYIQIPKCPNFKNPQKWKPYVATVSFWDVFLRRIVSNTVIFHECYSSHLQKTCILIVSAVCPNITKFKPSKLYSKCVMVCFRLYLLIKATSVPIHPSRANWPTNWCIFFDPSPANWPSTWLSWTAGLSCLYLTDGLEIKVCYKTGTYNY